MPTPKKSTSAAQKKLSPAATEAANQDVVDRFFVELVTKKNRDGVYEILSEDFVSRNPEVDGRQGMADFAAWQAENQPKAAIVDVIHSVAKGDLVIRHYTYASDPELGADLDIVDFFRVKGGKIVEYWDVIHSLKKDA
jgi:predicted SnoaL-like aldol condensation-catalyzing enzyme